MSSAFEYFDIAPAPRRGIIQVNSPLASPIEAVFGDVLTLTGTRSANLDTNGARLAYLTAAVTNDKAGIEGKQQWRRDLNLKAYFKIKIDSIANIRLFVGFADQTLATMLGSDNPAGNYCGLQYSSARPDSNFQYCNKDNTTQQLTNSNKAASTNLFHFFIFTFSNQIIYMLNRADVAAPVPDRQTVTLNMPVATANLQLVVGIITLTTAAKILDLGKAHYECEP